MKRKLFNLAALLSLLLCVAQVVVWVRSKFEWDEIGWVTVHIHGPLLVGPFAVNRSTYRIAAFDGAAMIEYRYEEWPFSMLAPVHPKGNGFYERHTKNPPYGPGFSFAHPLEFDGWTGPDHPGMRVSPRRSALGLQLETAQEDEHNRFLTFTFHLAHPFALTALLPALICIRRIHKVIRPRRNSRSGLCPTCKYNLTGNTSGVCPECGTAVAGKAGA